MRNYEKPNAKLLILGNDLLTASAEQDEPPQPCKCFSFPTYSSDPLGEDDCMRADQFGGFETRGGI